MPIHCDALKMSFFVPNMPGLNTFKLMLFDINVANGTQAVTRKYPGVRLINKIPGYLAMPVEDALNTVPEGYEKVAVTMDAAAYIATVACSAAQPRAFWKRRETDSLAEASLSPSPALSEFLEQIDDYANASKGVASALLGMHEALGDDLSIFDRVLRVDRPDEIEELFGAHLPTGTDLDQVSSCRKAMKSLIPSAARKLQEIVSDEVWQPFFYEREALEKIAEGDTGKFSIEIPELHRGPAVTHPLHVVCMLKETPEVVVRFVDYYSALGCRSINLYFDDPEDPTIALVEGREGVVITRCDAEFWGGKRKKNVPARQCFCYEACYNRLSGDGWLAVVDADEFLAAPNGSLDELMEQAPADQRVIRFNSAEAVWDRQAEDVSVFSAPYLRRQIPQDLGHIWLELKRTKSEKMRNSFHMGLLSHRSGKHMLRLGIEGAKPKNHKTIFNDGYDGMAVAEGHSKGVLVHFYALGFEAWRRKVKNRTGAAGKSAWGLDQSRIAQVEVYEEASDAEQLEVFLNLYGIKSYEIDLLARNDLLYRISVFEGLPPVS